MIDWKSARLGDYTNGMRAVYVPCAKSDDPRDAQAGVLKNPSPKPKAPKKKAGK